MIRIPQIFEKPRFGYNGETTSIKNIKIFSQLKKIE
jgi:hypothetical protein